MIRKKLLNNILYVFLLCLLPIIARAANPAVPDSGLILQQIQPIKEEAPSPSDTGLIIEEDGATKMPESRPFLVSSILISGNETFDNTTLNALIAGFEGNLLTLPQVEELSNRITNFYHSKGYPFARAIVPAQIIKSGIVQITVIEARYGKIIIHNNSRVQSKLIQATLSPLQSGLFISQAEMDRSLLLVSDISGMLLNATLKPGLAPATSDLVIDTDASPSITGNVSTDNYGSRYTGKARITGTVNYFNPLHSGDVLSVSGLSSGSGVNYASISYETLLNGIGTRIGGSYLSLHYELGGVFTSINVHGTVQAESTWVKQKFMRSNKANIYGKIEYNHKKLRDHVDASGTRTDRQLDSVSIKFSGDVFDSVLSSGFNLWSLGYTTGNLNFDNDVAKLADASTAFTQGRFNKWNIDFIRQQKLSTNLSLYVAISAQATNSNLDSSEKMISGGSHSVRAYDVGMLAGDNVVSEILELRHYLGTNKLGQWQAVAFLDNAHLIINQRIWSSGANSATLSGAGLGLNWVGANQWNASAYIATPIGTKPALISNNTSTQAWIEISKKF